jgi:hypothetical protein
MTFKFEWNWSNIIEFVGLVFMFYKMHTGNIKRLSSIETRIDIMYDWWRRHIVHGGATSDDDDETSA